MYRWSHIQSEDYFVDCGHVCRMSSCSNSHHDESNGEQLEMDVGAVTVIIVTENP